MSIKSLEVTATDDYKKHYEVLLDRIDAMPKEIEMEVKRSIRDSLRHVLNSLDSDIEKLQGNDSVEAKRLAVNFNNLKRTLRSKGIYD